MTRYVYSGHSSLISAKDALEEYYATGEISSSDRPKIERRGHSKKFYFYVITIIDPYS
jgi:hypothetical protein